MAKDLKVLKKSLIKQKFLISSLYNLFISENQSKKKLYGRVLKGTCDVYY